SEAGQLTGIEGRAVVVGIEGIERLELALEDVFRHRSARGHMRRGKRLDQTGRRIQAHILRGVYLGRCAARRVKAGILRVCWLVLDNLLLDWQRCRVALNSGQPAIHHIERLVISGGTSPAKEKPDYLVSVSTISSVEAIAFRE